MQHYKIKLPTKDQMENIYKEFPDVNFKNSHLLFKLVMVSHKMFGAMEKHFARYNLTKGKFQVLMFLFNEKKKKNVVLSDIAKKIYVSKSTITGLTDGLENLDYVERYTDPKKDRRKVFIRITEKGIKFIREIFPDHIHNISTLLSTFDEEEKIIFNTLLNKIDNQLQNINFEKFEFSEEK
ncbi:MAG: MarR family transcriptional regulator [Candidatus Cloacimonetes bacterium]|nr:MarR family transcriptional regulator [Candidatus Cloacimonadota bacterium]